MLWDLLNCYKTLNKYGSSIKHSSNSEHWEEHFMHSNVMLVNLFAKQQRVKSDERSVTLFEVFFLHKDTQANACLYPFTGWNVVTIVALSFTNLAQTLNHTTLVYHTKGFSLLFPKGATFLELKCQKATYASKTLWGLKLDTHCNHSSIPQRCTVKRKFSTGLKMCQNCPKNVV